MAKRPTLNIMAHRPGARSVVLHRQRHRLAASGKMTAVGLTQARRDALAES
jgi:hypothetical protein